MTFNQSSFFVLTTATVPAARARRAITGATALLPVLGIAETFAAGFFVVAGFAVVGAFVVSEP